MATFDKDSEHYYTQPLHPEDGVIAQAHLLHVARQAQYDQTLQTAQTLPSDARLTLQQQAATRLQTRVQRDQRRLRFWGSFMRFGARYPLRWPGTLVFLLLSLLGAGAGLRTMLPLDLGPIFLATSTLALALPPLFILHAWGWVSRTAKTLSVLETFCLFRAFTSSGLFLLAIVAGCLLGSGLSFRHTPPLFLLKTFGGTPTSVAQQQNWQGAWLFLKAPVDGESLPSASDSTQKSWSWVLGDAVERDQEQPHLKWTPPQGSPWDAVSQTKGMSLEQVQHWYQLNNTVPLCQKAQWCFPVHSLQELQTLGPQLSIPPRQLQSLVATMRRMEWLKTSPLSRLALPVLAFAFLFEAGCIFAIFLTHFPSDLDDFHRFIAALHATHWHERQQAREERANLLSALQLHPPSDAQRPRTASVSGSTSSMDSATLLDRSLSLTGGHESPPDASASASDSRQPPPRRTRRL